jgi:hypothetical protein
MLMPDDEATDLTIIVAPEDRETIVVHVTPEEETDNDAPVSPGSISMFGSGQTLEFIYPAEELARRRALLRQNRKAEVSDTSA